MKSRARGARCATARARRRRGRSLLRVGRHRRTERGGRGHCVKSGARRGRGAAVGACRRGRRSVCRVCRPDDCRRGQDPGRRLLYGRDTPLAHPARRSVGGQYAAPRRMDWDRRDSPFYHQDARAPGEIHDDISALHFDAISDSSTVPAHDKMRHRAHGRPRRLRQHRCQRSRAKPLGEARRRPRHPRHPLRRRPPRRRNRPRLHRQWRRSRRGLPCVRCRISSWAGTVLESEMASKWRAQISSWISPGARASWW